MARHEDSRPGTLSFFKPGEHAHPRPAPGLEAGKVIGDFRLVEMIGQGGMGQVWEAAQVSLGNRRVAVKFVRPEQVTEKQLSYFEREARAGGRLAHPGIVAVHGFGESDGVAWIAMELVEGCWTLRDFLDETARADELPADYDRGVARFVRQLAEALQAAHEGGVIHRDLKPQNVMITQSHEPKVTDFGLARITDELALSQTGDFAGTYYYMSPEQVAAKRMGIDHRTDVFSLGVVMYEMLTLRRPFQGDTSHQIAQQIVLHEPPDMRAVRSRIPRDLSVICGKALEKDPEKRYATMAELGADIERHLANEPIRARPPTRVERLVKWTRRNPTKSVASAVAVLAFVVISALGLRLSRSNAALETRTDEARENAAAEKRRADEVMRLSLAQDHADLMLDAGALWPAHPDRIEAFKEWTSRATDLMDQLPTLVAKRDELRALARPQTDEDRRAEREGHAEFPELQRVEGELAFRRRALAQRRSKAGAPLPDVDWSAYPADASGLNAVAWPLVDPERDSFGAEALGWVLAERALELASAEERVAVGVTLSQASFALGLDGEALEVAFVAMEEAPADRRAELEAALQALEEAVAGATSEEGLAEEAGRVEELEGRLSDLTARVDERRTWTFSEEQEDETQARWWHNQLRGLIGELESLTVPGEGLLSEDGVSAEHGWSVPRRRAFAERLEAGFAPDGEFASRWAKARPAIDQAYPGLELAPQMGLVPIGPDPVSGLWEFWHVATGAEPQRGADGRLVLTEEMGVVLVLLPGGSFWMGAQRKDPDGRNYDPHANDNEEPVHEVTLTGFFLSKYEMTQGQWKRFSGHNPSRYGPDGEWAPGWRVDRSPASLLHPVEQVSWLDCAAWMSRMGLSFPSEAQWEYGCRAEKDTVWWSGAEPKSLRGVANLADVYARSHGGSGWTGVMEWLDDGSAVHAPVGTYLPNGFGLHDVHGNLWELCLDGYDEGFFARSPELNPLVPDAGSGGRITRGGSFLNADILARSSFRLGNAPSFADFHLGLRPAGVITD